MVEPTAEQREALALFELERLKSAEKSRRQRKNVLGLGAVLLSFGPVILGIGFAGLVRVPGDMGSTLITMSGVLMLAYGLGDLVVALRRQTEETGELRERLAAIERRLAQS